MAVALLRRASLPNHERRRCASIGQADLEFKKIDTDAISLETMETSKMRELILTIRTQYAAITMGYPDTFGLRINVPQEWYIA